MSLDAFDPDIIQDFLTESGELLEELEVDLVTLEDTPEDLELLNKVFRALHTIKGSASFLALTNLVDVAHAAETALNAARSGEVTVDHEAMDLLLEAVDTVRLHMQQITDGEALAEPNPQVVAGLIRIGSGKQASADGGGDEADASPVAETATAVAPAPGEANVAPLSLPENKTDLVDFLLTDLDDTLEQIDGQLASLRSEAERSSAADSLVELGESLARSAEFFEFGQMAELAQLLNATGEAAPSLDDRHMQSLMPRVEAIAQILREQAGGLADRQVITKPTGSLTERVQQLLAGDGVDEAIELAEDATPDAALALDAPASLGNPDAPGAPPEPADTAQTSDTSTTSSEQPAAVDPAEPAGKAAANASPPASGPTSGPAAVEQTIRVEVGRLETLMNLVGELVLQKNRVAALARQLDTNEQIDNDYREEVSVAAGNLDRTTSDIQVAVMRTRMQPLDKLFGKYPRLIRDLAGKTGKKIQLVIEGGETEVDKSVLEELGDPMVHLLRNAADHGLEGPDDRVAAGKDETGTIRIVAAHEGSHVSVRIIDDGRGMTRERIAAKAVEKGIATEQEISQLSDREVYRFILAAGFSTAAEVTDLSGRGVGMDVVRTNIEALKGTIDVDSTPGEGSEITIAIPLTVAIMPAMMVRVDSEIYAIPLSNLLEIVRPEADRISTINGHPVLRVRDSILPLLSAQELFETDPESREDAPFAVVIQHNDRAFGLLVSELIGQQEIVIKPLDAMFDQTGPVSGATVKDDGGVSLIVDVAQMARIAENKQQG
ncbi:MAG: chemotaxis protein CheA [Planctomycetota bacterium]